MSKKILILKDYKMGSFNILQGISNYLSGEKIIKEVKYTKWSSLPNFLAFFFPTAKNEKEILKTKSDILLSAGRRSALIASKYKKKYPKTFVIQVLNPNMNYGNFDMVILPSHDGKSSTSKKVIILDIMPQPLTKSKLKEAELKKKNLLKGTKGPYITAVVGGSYKNGIFTEEMAKDFGMQINNLSKKTKSTLLISFSRRTGDKNIEIIKSKIKTPYVYCDYKSGDSFETYLSFLSKADMLVITGDSISSLTEGCFTGKPIYVYDNEKLLSHKHKRFIDFLYKNTLCKPLSFSKIFTPSKFIDSGELIAKKIMEKLK